MLIEKVEHLKEWLTDSLAPICEADSGALAKYVVALVKKDRPESELKDSCCDQLDVFLQGKTRDFVDSLFEVLVDKTYIKPEEPKPEVVPDTTDSLPEFPEVPPLGDENQQPTAGTPVEDELKINDEENDKEAIAAEEPKKILSRSRSKSPRYTHRARDEDRRRRYDDRPPFDRDRRFARRRSISPRDLRHRVIGRGRSRSPLRRRSPFRPIQRSKSPRPRGRGRSRSWSRSMSPPPKKSWSRSRSRERFRSRSRSGPPRSRSPRREVRPPRLRSRSPRGRSRSPRYWSPRKRSRSPGNRSPRSRSRTPLSRRGSKSPRSRSWSPARKVRRHSSNSRGPTPTEENGLADSTNASGSPSRISVVTQSGGRYVDAQPRSTLRCRDFDEKGFCVRGDLCMFDHGVDPVIVEKVPHPQFPPGVPPPGHPGGPPPGMNIPPPGFLPRMPPGMMIRGPRPEFHQEPYNPEAPGITVPPPPGYWPGGPGLPPPHFMTHPPPPPVTSKPPTRELVSITDVKKEIKVEEEEIEEPTSSSSTRTVIAPKDDTPTSSTQPLPPGTQEITSTVVKVEATPGYQQPVIPGYNPHPFIRPQRFHPYGGHRKPFDYNRIGGYRKPDQTKCTLEVRKVPKEFNNIAKLNEHFGKFGTLTNLQVAYEGDPEGALVTYSSNAEAAACYRSSEPVFNNRFIKVFWHNKENKETANIQEQAPTSTTTPIVIDDASRPPAQTRLGPLPPMSKLSLNNTLKKAQTQPHVHAPQAPPQVPQAHPQGLPQAPTAVPVEKAVAYTSSMGNISKTVYNPAAIRAKAAKNELTSPTAVKAADFVARMEAVKQHEAIKKEAALKKLEIQKYKQQLLEKQIEQQKVLISKLEAKKEMPAEEKAVFMKTLKTLTDSIDKLKTELGRRVVVKKDGAEPVTVKSPEQAKKEILDVELELMTKTTKGEDTLELKTKLLELQKIANSMGLLGRGRGRGAVARGRGSTTWVASGITPPVVGRGRGRGALLGHASVAARTLDRRPKQVEVSGFTTEEKEDVALHLGKLEELENIDFKMEVPCAILSFKTRRDAELGILHGSKFKTKVLKMTWHIPKPDVSSSASHVSADSDLDTEGGLEELDEEALLAEEDDESDDTRSWRR